MTIAVCVYSFKRKTISGRGSADPMEICLGTCHSLCVVNGQLVGDPVDLAMFSAIAWVCSYYSRPTTLLVVGFIIHFACTALSYDTFKAVIVIVVIGVVKELIFVD